MKAADRMTHSDPRDPSYRAPEVIYIDGDDMDFDPLPDRLVEVSRPTQIASFDDFGKLLAATRRDPKKKAELLSAFESDESPAERLTA